MRTYLLERSQIIPRSRAETFAFFSNTANLEQITPTFLRFRVLSSAPEQIGAGTLIEYRLALFGVAFGWRTLIEAWEPERLFIDRQINGPYSLWRHTHTFAELGPHSTLMRDEVLYRLECKPFGGLAHWLFVGRMVKRIFAYRAETIARLLPPTLTNG